MARGVAGTGASIGAGVVASERAEIVMRSERCRSFRAEEKVRLLAEAFQPGETVTACGTGRGAERRAARPQLLPVRPMAPVPQPEPAPVSDIAPTPTEVVLRNGRALRVQGVKVTKMPGFAGAHCAGYNRLSLPHLQECRLPLSCGAICGFGEPECIRYEHKSDWTRGSGQHVR